MADPRTTPGATPPPARGGRGWGWILGLIILIAVVWLVFEMWGGEPETVEAPVAEEVIGEESIGPEPMPEPAAEPAVQPDFGDTENMEGGDPPLEPGTGAVIEE